MKKKSGILFFALLFSLLCTFSVCAEGTVPRLIDDADLLSDEEETELLEKLDETSERQKVDIVVVTVPSLEGASAMEYADDFYDENGYGYGEEQDGILFLISMEERDWYISTSGYGITAFTDAGLEYLSERCLDDLSGGFYADAFTTFADLCDDYITQARTGQPYDVDFLPKEPFWFGGELVLSFGIAFIIALIATGIMKSKLKSVHSQTKADNYIKKGSLKLAKKNDLFLYKQVERKEKPKNTPQSPPPRSTSSGGSTTHKSSSGKTHGGKGGKF